LRGRLGPLEEDGIHLDGPDRDERRELDRLEEPALDLHEDDVTVRHLGFLERRPEPLLVVVERDARPALLLRERPESPLPVDRRRPRRARAPHVSEQPVIAVAGRPEPQVGALGCRDTATLVGPVTPGHLPFPSVRARTWILVLVGAILVGFASFLFALTRDPDGWSGLTMKELAIRSIVVGASVGAVLGLLVARVSLPSGRRRLWLVTLLAVVGAASGILLTLAAGEYCSDGVVESWCGLNFLVWNFSSEVATALSATLGAVVGALLGFVAGLVFLRRDPAT
jgi:hypothetical protein